MTYRSFPPAVPLRPYIERYWLLTTRQRAGEEAVTLLPEGGINLVLNLGESVRSRNFPDMFGSEGPLLVGIMLRSDEQLLRGESRLFGIQFRPGAFTHFYRYESMDYSANKVQEFNRKEFPDLKKTIRYFVPYIDWFYLNRLSPPRYSLMSVVADIEQRRGQAKIEALAKRHFTTERQLERQFKFQIGVSPKEFIGLTRFRFALERIQRDGHRRSLADIAWDCGYYDHAHLANDFKQYTGSSPSSFILSDFSKTIAADPY